MSHQLSLFPDPLESESQIRRDYHGIPGLAYLQTFLDAKEQKHTLAEVDSREQEWRDDLKRRVQHYGYRYDYKARRVDPSMFVGPLPEFAVQIAKKLVHQGLLTKEPDQMIVNEYQPGQGITPHIDCEPCFEDEIATISLGAVYPMDLIEIASGTTHTLRLAAGSCMVFTRDARYRWRHGIKPRVTDNGKRRGRRVSLTFRKVIVTAGEDRQ